MEDKKDKKIRLLSEEVDRLRNENAELQEKMNEMSTIHNEATIAYFQSYEQELKDQIEKAKKLCSLYEILISKQKKFYAKEKGKYKKATNRAITEFNKSLS